MLPFTRKDSLALPEVSAEANSPELSPALIASPSAVLFILRFRNPPALCEPCACAERPDRDREGDGVDGLAVAAAAWVALGVVLGGAPGVAAGVAPAFGAGAAATTLGAGAAPGAASEIGSGLPSGFKSSVHSTVEGLSSTVISRRAAEKPNISTC